MSNEEIVKQLKIANKIAAMNALANFGRNIVYEPHFHMFLRKITGEELKEK